MSYRYIDGDGEVSGPVDLQGLRQLRARGELSDESSVRRDGESEWHPLKVYLGEVPITAQATPQESTRTGDDGGRTPVRAITGVLLAAMRDAAQGFSVTTRSRNSAVDIDSLSPRIRPGRAPESPTEIALARVVAIQQPIAGTQLPGQHIHSLKRAGVLFTAFVVASVVGVYTRGALDALADRREAARQEADERRMEAESRRREEAYQAQLAEEQYRSLARQMPARRLQELLREAGSREALVRRAHQDWDGNWILREE